jgi:hypothetical protein
VFKGLFGPLIIRRPGVPVPDREFFLKFHSFTPLATGLDNTFSCVNGRAYAGNTPTLRAKVGQTVAFHVFALDNDFHTFHLHGHRWTDPDGGLVIDNKTIALGRTRHDAFGHGHLGQRSRARLRPAQQRAAPQGR